MEPLYTYMFTTRTKAKYLSMAITCQWPLTGQWQWPSPVKSHAPVNGHHFPKDVPYLQIFQYALQYFMVKHHWELPAKL